MVVTTIGAIAATTAPTYKNHDTQNSIATVLSLQELYMKKIAKHYNRTTRDLAGAWSGVIPNPLNFI